MNQSLTNAKIAMQNIFSARLVWFTLIGTVGIAFILGMFAFMPKDKQGLSAEEQINLVRDVRANQSEYISKRVSATEGGTLEVNDGNLSVTFPAGFSDQDLEISYHELRDDFAYANSRVGPMYELLARNTSGGKVTKFKLPITITTKLNSEVNAGAGTFFYDADAKTWRKLESKVSLEERQITASSDHFTIFTSATSNPNTPVKAALGEDIQVSAEAEVDPEIVTIDNSDPEPYFRIETFGTLLNWQVNPSGENNSSIYTKRTSEHDLQKFNNLWWEKDGITGEKEVFVSIPSVPGVVLASEVTYIVTAAGETETEVVIDQQANAGKWVSLGTYEFDGTGRVFSSNLVYNGSGNYVVVDAVRFGGELDENADLTPPLIENVVAVTYQDGSGKFTIQATITDEGSGVVAAVLYLKVNGVIREVAMTAGANDVYYATVTGIPQGATLDYEIHALDAAGNEGVWTKERGYVARGSFGRYLGYHPGMIVKKKSPTYAKEGCGAVGSACGSQTQGDPINTLNGNLIEEHKLVETGGNPAMTLDLTYNSQGGFLSIFGENWTHSYNYHLLYMDNPDVTGAFVQYPDGFMATFSGADLTAEPGVFDELRKSGDGFILAKKNGEEIYFDSDGDITRWEDKNDSGINFEYGTKFKYTLLSQIKSMKVESGRELYFEYDANGLIAKINTNFGETFAFTHENDDLTSIVDARAKTTKFEYNDHNLVNKVSPKGHSYYQNSYDGERRVIKQNAGIDFETTYVYGSNETVVTDKNSNKTVYRYNSDKLLKELEDAKGYKFRYEFDSDKNVSKFTDKDGNEYDYKYDEFGNKTLEIDPQGKKITVEYAEGSDRPTKEVYKEDDHTREWKYDSRGNLVEITDAYGSKSNFDYDDNGNLIKSNDFNGNETNYEYSPAGDLIKVVDPEGNTIHYTYDSKGRVSVFRNGRGFEYNFSYDGNDNVLKIAGPLGYELKYSYDDNNHLVEDVDANGGKITFSFNNSEVQASRKNQLGFEMSSAYGPMNELLKFTDPRDHSTAFAYDQVYNEVESKEAVGTDVEQTTKTTYNGMRKVTSRTDAEGRVTEYKYDSLERVVEKIENKTDADSNSENNVKTVYKYDAVGNIVEFVDPNGHSTHYQYDRLDRLVEEKDAENQIKKYKYDKQSNLIEMIDAEGHKTAYEYDKLNQLKKVIDAKNGETKYSYDANGNLVSQTDANGIVTAFTFDELDRKATEIKNYKVDTAVSSDVNVTTKYSYDLHGNLLEIINPNGNPTKFKYDAAHRNVVIIDAYGKETKLTYDSTDNLLQTLDRNGNVKNYSYDPLNRLIKSVNEEGHAESIIYDRVDNETSFTNRRGETYQMAIDPLNRVKSIVNPLTKSEGWDYDANGNVLKYTDHNGHSTNFSYDKVDRLISKTDAEDNKTQYEYDKNNNQTKVIDANGNATVFKFDELNRLVEEVNAEAEVTRYSYDALINLTGRVDADNTAHKYTYDPIYRLAEVVNNFKADAQANSDTNVKTKYEYDANGNLLASVNPLSNKTTFAYDKLDRLIVETNPLTNSWNYTYDAEGNRIMRKDANGAITNYGYYPDNMVKTITYPDHNVGYTYNETNFVTGMSDKLGQTNWGYDKLDRMTAQKDAFGREIKYDYDNVGNLTKFAHPDGRTVSHEYLKNDWLKMSATSDNDVSRYSKDKVGNILAVERSNNTKAEIKYDKVYRPLQVHDQQTVAGKGLINEYNYKYDPMGHITEETTKYGWRQPAEVKTDYKYDGLNRLVEAKNSESSSRYNYDAAGNRVKMWERIDNKGDEERSYSYNAANQLSSIQINSPKAPNNIAYEFKYDKNGNRIDKLIKDGTGVERGNKYEYDYENRLTTAHEYQSELSKGASKVNWLGKTALEYDGNSRRMVNTYYPGASAPGQRVEYTFSGFDPVSEYDKLNGQKKNLYRDGENNLISYQDFKSEQAPDGTNYFYHYDGKGNITATSKSTGQSDHAYRLDEYGGILPEVGGDKNSNNGAGWVAPHNAYVLTQKQYDSNTDLYYFGARHYDSDTATWLTQDTYRGELMNPMSQHRYMYADDNPRNNFDIYGFETVPHVQEAIDAARVDISGAACAGDAYVYANNTCYSIDKLKRIQIDETEWFQKERAVDLYKISRVEATQSWFAAVDYTKDRIAPGGIWDFKDSRYENLQNIIEELEKRDIHLTPIVIDGIAPMDAAGPANILFGSATKQLGIPLWMANGLGDVKQFTKWDQLSVSAKNFFTSLRFEHADDLEQVRFGYGYTKPIGIGERIKFNTNRTANKFEAWILSGGFCNYSWR